MPRHKKYLQKEKHESLKKILHFVLENKKTTRREIEKQTGYSWSTISSSITLLLDKKILIESDPVVSGVGRSTSYLTPNGEHFVAIGVDVNSVGYSTSIIGIDGRNYHHFNLPFDSDKQMDIILRLYECLNNAIALIDKEKEIYSIGVSFQGKPSPNEDIASFPFSSDWKSINIKNIIEEKYNIFTHVDHDVTCLLRDYLYQKDKKDVTSLALLRFVAGIGCVIYTRNNILNDNLPINVGQWIINPELGKDGTFEYMASTLGIEKQTKVTFDKVNINRDAYEKTFSQVAKYIGLTLTYIRDGYLFCDNGQIKYVLTGPVIDNDEKLLDKIKESYNNFSRHEETTIFEVNSTLSASRGAAILSYLLK